MFFRFYRQRAGSATPVEESASVARQLQCRIPSCAGWISGHRLGQRRLLAPYYLENRADLDALLAELRDQSQTA